MSNILFVLYHDFSANSAVHVHNLANQLAALGHSTAVAIPEDMDRGAALGEQSYSIQRFDQVEGEWSRVFPNGRPPDVVHAWTPRENVRLFCEKLAGLCDFSLFVHLEDNEELILEVNLGTSFEKLARSSSAEIPGNGIVADPGFSVVVPGSGVIMMAPVSVCHQVSTTGQRSPPMTWWYQIQASGLMGSPTEPRRRRDVRSWRAGHSVPQRMKARMAVGAV